MERFTYGPMEYYFCSEKHERRYWYERASNVNLYKWLRASPDRRTDKLLRMTPDERRMRGGSRNAAARLSAKQDALVKKYSQPTVFEGPSGLGRRSGYNSMPALPAKYSTPSTFKNKLQIKNALFSVL